jgi:hypothetical protein
MTETEEIPKINGAVETNINDNPELVEEEIEEDDFDDSLLTEEIEDIPVITEKTIITEVISNTQEISTTSNLESESAGFESSSPADSAIHPTTDNAQEISNSPINLESESAGFTPILPVDSSIPEEDDDNDEEEMEESEDDGNNEEGEEDSSGRTPQKDLIAEMRGLLTNYPLFIKFSENRDFVSIIENLILIKDLLNYCRYKTTKDSILKLINAELEDLK